MKIFCGILFLLFCCCNLVITFNYRLYQRCEKNKVIVWSSIICAGFCFIVAMDIFGAFDTQKEFPASEYRMSIKTTTIDDKTDTTYVITEIK